MLTTQLTTTGHIRIKNIYKFKIEVSGIEGESHVTFIILTNDEETSFEDVSYSLKKAECCR
ncbi:hypothetical protein [Lachnoclostridium phytofermentans]|uniref:hypothetical protein n=1 Tax=Lachnoclostridium phytofermentans TaxID=66219 RepID=UPI0002D9F605|nr:hypothetical protein [Lachnoclostridium phytofermentans]